MAEAFAGFFFVLVGPAATGPTAFSPLPFLNPTPNFFIFTVPAFRAAANLFFALVTAPFWARRLSAPLIELSAASIAASLPLAAATFRRAGSDPRAFAGFEPFVLPLAGEAGPDGRLEREPPPPPAKRPLESRL